MVDGWGACLRSAQTPLLRRAQARVYDGGSIPTTNFQFVTVSTVIVVVLAGSRGRGVAD